MERVKNQIVGRGADLREPTLVAYTRAMPKPLIDFANIRDELESESSDRTPTHSRHSRPATPHSDSAAPTPSRPVARRQTEQKTSRKTVVVFILILCVWLGIKAISWGAPATNGAQAASSSFWSQVKNLVTSRDRQLEGETDDRINFLLLGMGGEGHDGPYLTDTIILGSFRPSDKHIALLSIPRDLVIPIPGYGWRKVNNANAYGELTNPGHGADLAVKTISQVFGLPIQYYLRVDFAGFKDFIDELGGVKVCVDNAFTDVQYPTDDYKTQTIKFDTGCQLMSGDTALQFVRSRHGNNGEGSDFARSRRQQKVILAAKEKLLTFSTLSNPLTIKNLFTQYQNHVSTNLDIWEMVRFAQLAKGTGQENIQTHGLVEGPGGQLQTVIGEDGAYLLQPPGGSYDEIRKLVAAMLDTSAATPTAVTNPTPTPAIAAPATTEPVAADKTLKKAIKEKATIEVRNGTFISGLASTTQARLVALGLTVGTIGNTPLRDYDQNVVYDLSSGKFPATLETLTAELGATATTTIPTWLHNIATGDIVVVLGHE